MDADVCIVGHGPVGNVLSILLAQLGHRVEVLERHSSTYPLPRAVHFDGETARILQACGIGELLPSLSSSSGVYEWRNAAGQTLLRFRTNLDSGTGWPHGNMFCQPELERALDTRIPSLPSLRVRRSVDVTDVAQDADGVAVTHSAGTTRSRFLVACDGANSTVRSILATPVTDLGFFYDWLICDVILHESRVYDPENLQVCDPHRPTTVVSGGPGRRRWEFMRLPHESKDDLNTEARAWELLAPWDVHPGTATLERHTVYTFQARWVDEWRRGRVLLAGDAAHQTPPFAGQGLCAGLRDAMNLYWKLDHVLRGVAPESLLDTYGTERQPNVRAYIELAMELGNVICVPDPADAAQRDAAMVAAFEEQVRSGDVGGMPPGPVVVDGLFGDGDAVGHLMVQGPAATVGATPALFDDVVGVGWRLICAPGTPHLGDASLVAWFTDAIGGSTHIVGDTGDLADVDGRYARWFADHGVGAALQRPDFKVFGTVPPGASPASLVQSLRSSLSAS